MYQVHLYLYAINTLLHTIAYTLLMMKNQGRLYNINFTIYKYNLFKFVDIFNIYSYLFLNF